MTFKWAQVTYFLGGFEIGDSSTYPGNVLVNRSLTLGESIIYVSANYRLNGVYLSRSFAVSPLFP